MDLHAGNYKFSDVRVAIRCQACDARHPGATAPAFAVMLYGLPEPHLQRPWWYHGKAQEDSCWWLAWVDHRTLASAARAKVVLNPERLLAYRQQGRRRVDAVMPEGAGELVPLTRRKDSVQLGPCRASRCKSAPRVHAGVLIDKAGGALHAGGDIYV